MGDTLKGTLKRESSHRGYPWGREMGEISQDKFTIGLPLAKRVIGDVYSGVYAEGRA